MFNLRVPLARDEVFLMNTLTDAQLVVSTDVVDLLDRVSDVTVNALDGNARDAFDLLWDNGFLVQDRAADRQALDRCLGEVKSDTAELHVTLLTALQCNFACDYCFQGDHGDYNERADRMSLETAGRTVAWMTRELDRVKPGKLVLTFFGGEPLLNLPVMYDVADRMWQATQDRQVPMYVNIITNGLLLTPAVVDRMLPFGLNGVKITLDGDRDTHNRMRPLRGGQGTFDRIVENIRQVAGRCRIAVGGNFDESSVDSYPALLEFLKEQDFADKLSKVFFKPIVRTEPVSAKGIIPLTPIAAKDSLKGTCMTSVGSGAGKACDSCNVLDDKLTFLRQETGRLGFPTHDGVHNQSVPRAQAARAHDRPTARSTRAPASPASSRCRPDTSTTAAIRGGSRPERFTRLSPWKEVETAPYIPVCAGGASPPPIRSLAT